ncbi:MAG: NAD(P)-binding domain-containing protein [Planctomycetaceae bacterium]|nr:NAD(P)-binding domain-containing protein [Planctomycetaceae bacterium]
MTFNKIVTADFCGLTGPAVEDILALSASTAVIHNDDPESDEDLIRRVGAADCVLVSWRTKMSAEIFAACPAIRYVGMCCTLYDEKSANVDILESRKRGIVVKGVTDYGDEGTNEFIFAELISLFKGLGDRKWGDGSSELTSKTLGIVGLGVLGKMVAKTALQFGMKVVYFSRTRKDDMEALGIAYRDLDQLLQESDVISAHLPRNTKLFTAREFALMKETVVFINTSLGQPFDADALFAWTANQTGNYAIFDLPGSGTVTEECAKHPNIILYPHPSGFTREARIRLTNKVYTNMLDFLAQR